MKTLKVGVIYKITYPNGKIYIGQDRTDDINYFGSADSHTIARDFGVWKQEFIIKKEILYRKHGISIQDLNKKERAFIEKNRSNDPRIGYNRMPGNPRQKCVAQFKE